MQAVDAGGVTASCNQHTMAAECPQPRASCCAPDALSCFVAVNRPLWETALACGEQHVVSSLWRVQHECQRITAFIGNGGPLPHLRELLRLVGTGADDQVHWVHAHRHSLDQHLEAREFRQEGWSRTGVWVCACRRADCKTYVSRLCSAALRYASQPHERSLACPPVCSDQLLHTARQKQQPATGNAAPHSCTGLPGWASWWEWAHPQAAAPRCRRTR